MSNAPEKHKSAETAHRLAEYLKILVLKYDSPPVPEDLAAIDGVANICEVLIELKSALKKFSEGDFDLNIKQRGTLIGKLKALQGNFRHLDWQCKTVADGDLNQRVDFMGELSSSFNRMTDSLAAQYALIEEKQRELTKLTQKLQQEVKRKEEIAATLQISEEMYRQKSLRDPLTGIYNRSYFFETAAREMENLKRQDSGAACLLMLDIDHFKSFNDTYGHLLGDQAIKMVTSSIDKTLRRSDIFARYGGEEFVLLLSNTNLEDGLVIAERIRQTVSEQPLPAEADLGPITISIGLCAIKGASLNPLNSGERILTSAIAEADSVLYAAKEKGRNMVCVSDKMSGRPRNT